MSDPGPLLATLAQSSAAIVAIVGGFLVSRLVALSSEREGLRRQLTATKDRLWRVAREYDEAHDYRFVRSSSDFESWTLSEVVEHRANFDLEKVLSENIPRGSSEDEMRPVLVALRDRVAEIEDEVRTYIRQDDLTSLSLGDLEKRGLTVRPADRDKYEHVVDDIAEKELPDQPGSIFGTSIRPIIRDSSIFVNDHGTSSRRLDEAIAQEQAMATQKSILEADERRLKADIAALGRPVGVTSAIVILAIYSTLGIVLPVVVMATSPTSLSMLALVGLVAAFAIGLFAVLGCMLWYARTLNDPIDVPEVSGTSRPGWL